MTAHLATLIQDALGPDYRIEQELDGGGMSRLFLTTDVRHGRRVVVKVLSPELVTETSTARFKREIELTVRLQHPHILPVLTSGARDDVLYYITPFIAGESLKARIQRDGKLPLNDVVKILTDASEALAFAHARGVVHRDVKPGNILLAEGHAILADFGIAKAVGADVTALTMTGVMVGTPAYMAPELPTEESSDVFALAVVAYELLCGVLPRRGVTVASVLTARGHVAGDAPDRLRNLVALVADALSPSSPRRPATAAAFVDRLAGTPRIRTVPRLRTALALVAGGVLVAAGIAVWARARGVDVSDDRYAVLALGTPDSAASTAVHDVTDAFGEWTGLSVVDRNVMSDAAGGAPRAADVRAAWRVARTVHARNLVVVDLSRVPDSTVVRANLYDVRGDTLTRMRQVAMADGAVPGVRAMELRRLVNGLVRGGDELPWADAADRRPADLPAWRAYDRGRDALARWELAPAESAFRIAATSERPSSLASMWLAQTLLWKGGADPAAEARALLRKAASAAPALSPRDSTRVVALSAMADARFVVACAAFDVLVRQDSTDYGAWLGRGDCQMRDRMVVRSTASPTGWAFRSSFENAARAYQRAGDLGPSVNGSHFRGWLLGRLSAVMYAVTNRVRLGYTVNPDSVPFASFPYLDHDTTAFAPYPASQFALGSHDPAPAAVQAAVVRHRAALRGAAEDWVRHSPENAAAYDSLAAWTEVSGGMATIGERPASDLDVVRQALSLARDSTERLRLEITRTRLLLKRGRFADARAVADSVLRSGAGRRAADVPGVAGLAALLGRADEAAAYLASQPDSRGVRLPDGSVAAVPAQIAGIVARIVVRAALGLPADSTRVLVAQVRGLIDSYVPDPRMAAEWQIGLLGIPLTFMYPDAVDLERAIGAGSDAVSQAYLALAKGDSVGATRKLAEIRARSAGRVSGVSIDGNLRRARLSLALGDTAAAAAEIDPVLRALPLLAPSLLDQVTQVASLVRALALRAELSASHDRTAAAECANAVVALWSGGDRQLQPVVARMRALAQ